MRHQLDRPIAVDTTQQVLQARRLRGELETCLLDSTNRRLHRISGYRQFLADVDERGDSANPNLDGPAVVGRDDEGER